MVIEINHLVRKLDVEKNGKCAKLGGQGLRPESVS